MEGQTTRVSTVTEVQLTSGNELSGLDLKNPFVAVQVDSNRINTTFSAILDALQNVRVVVSNVVDAVEGNKSSISSLQSDLKDFRKEWEEDPRIAELKQTTEGHNDRITALEEQLGALRERFERMDQRIAKQESKRVDFAPLEDQIKKLAKEVASLDDSQKDIRSSCDSNTEGLKKIQSTLAENERQLADTDELVKAVYKIFEMSEKQVLDITRDPKQTRVQRQDTQATGLTEYVLSLPAFKTLRADFTGELTAVSTRLGDELQIQKKKLAEESVHLRSKLGEKLDEKKFQPVVRDLDALTKRVHDLEPRLDRIVDELDTKATLSSVQKMYDHLDQVKADKGDLVGLLHRDDLIPLEKDIQQLAEAIDRSGAKLKLEMGEIKNRGDGGNSNTSALRRSSADDKAIHAKITSLEEGVQTIKEDYVRKGDLNDCYMYVDNNLAKIQVQLKNMPPPGPPVGNMTSPLDTSQTDGDGNLSRPTSGKKRLAPLLRPPSAGKGRAETPPSASIPAETRAPSPPINYTSSPAKYVPNPAKYRATASLFDSEGVRTNASVTAANVPIVDHWHNVARAAAGEEVVPPSMRTHSME